MQGPLRVWLLRGIFLLALMLIGGVAMLYGVREIEKKDAFCGTCHVDDHRMKIEQSLADEAETLSAFHHIKKDVRCINCHGYDSLLGRVETMILATKSLIHYMTGDFEEPIRVTEPIRDENCIKCHPSNRPHPLGEDEFHGRMDHMTISIPCVDCHKGHKTGEPTHSYLVRSEVLSQCAECHPERGG